MSDDPTTPGRDDSEPTTTSKLPEPDPTPDAEPIDASTRRTDAPAGSAEASTGHADASAGTEASTRAAEASDTKPPARPTGRSRGWRWRRPWVWVVGGVAAVLVLLLLFGCVAAFALARFGWEAADDERDDDRQQDRMAVACQELETRLNRLVPPGATGGDPLARAGAVRDENSAVRPLLAEVDAMAAQRERHRGDRENRRRVEWADDLRQLLDARTGYADALQRQRETGEAAFFVIPRTERGEPVVTVLRRTGPDACAAPVRRLAQPDL